MPTDSTLVYIHVPGDKLHVDLGWRFVHSYHRFPPQSVHRTMIVCNGADVDYRVRNIFHSLPNVEYYVHDDTGWDVGAYIAVAKNAVKDDWLFCCGGNTHFHRAGWLRRMEEARDTHGPGIYGSLATYQIRPHFCTTGFFLPAQMLAAYPCPVRNDAERHHFETGRLSLCRWVLARGYPALLVTWDGEWPWTQWRDPSNCYLRGDQSNCLVHFRVSDLYEQASPTEKEAHERSADILTTAFIL